MLESEKEKIDRIINLKKQLKDEFPRIAIFVILFNGEKYLKKVLKRIHPKLMEIIEEIYVIDDCSEDRGYEAGKELMTKKEYKKLQIFRNPEIYGYGGNQKVGFKYALDRGFDYVILLHGDGKYAPEYLPDLLIPALFNKKQVVFGSRMMQEGEALENGMPRYKYYGNKVLTKIENYILTMNLSEYHSGYRLYSKNVLSKIPFQMNSNDFHFDTQIIIQCRALGLKIHEIPIPTYYGKEVTYVKGIKYAVNVLWSVIEYRLHQLHVLRREKYFVTLDKKYALKKFRYSSHRVIVDSIKPSSTIMDIGCGEGLLMEHYLKKNLTVSGIDLLPQEKVDSRMKDYLQWDIEDLEHVKWDKKCNYVIWADCLEHIKNHRSSLIASKKWLKDNGLMILSTGNIAIWFYRLSLLMGRFSYDDRGVLDRTHVYLYTKSSFEAELMNAGLEIIEFKYTSLPFELIFESVTDRPFIRLLNDLYYLLVKICPPLFAYQIIAIAKKADEINESKSMKTEYVQHSIEYFKKQKSVIQNELQ